MVENNQNPARGIDKFREQHRERFLSLDELERLGAAIREAETVGVPWQIDPAKKTKHLRKANREQSSASMRPLRCAC